MAEEKNIGKYIGAIGRRKTSVARVRLYDSAPEKKLIINEKDGNEYFGKNLAIAEKINSPLKLLNMENKFLITVKVDGGGTTGQAEAIRLGISRALLKMNESYKKELKSRGFLTRDPREVERKKAGLKKARKAPQWQKR
ncbi:MAG: 30S ribosomal protein S9 [Candidatus Paceibacterota bacterium]|jgi:small subunit ribosomal protein S9